MWVGVLSNTHGELNSELFNIFDGMDFIIHCGGIGGERVLEELSNISPTSGVLGNGDVAEEYPFEEVLVREMGGVPVLTTHAVNNPAEPDARIRDLLELYEPKVILFGNGEETYNVTIDDRFWFNPGPGHLGAGILEIDGSSIRGQLVTFSS